MTPRRALLVPLTALVLLATAACGTPGAVTAAFAERFPGEHVQEWEQQPYGWEAVFHGPEGETEAEFAADGRWLETEVEVYRGQGFPEPVLAAVDRVVGQRFGPVGRADLVVDKWEVETTRNGRFYEIELVGGDGEWYFDATGAPARNEHEDA